MSAAALIGGCACGFVVAVAALIGLGAARTSRRSPRGIAGQLRKHREFAIEISDTRARNIAFWDPSTPWGPRNGIRGPGYGTYRVDESGLVHLLWTASGQPPRELIGPFPEYVLRKQRREGPNRWAMRVVLALTISPTSGFLLAYATVGGGTSERVAGGAAAALASFMLAYVVLFFLVRHAMARRDGNKSGVS